MKTTVDALDGGGTMAGMSRDTSQAAGEPTVNRRDFVAALAIAIPLPAMLPQRIIFVYYYDGPNFTLWQPQWERCLVQGDRVLRLAGKGYFEMSHVRRHLYWVEDSRLNVPTDPGSRASRPDKMPY